MTCAMVKLSIFEKIIFLNKKELIKIEKYIVILISLYIPYIFLDLNVIMINLNNFFIF